jgi:hypothetical protein
MYKTGGLPGKIGCQASATFKCSSKHILNQSRAQAVAMSSQDIVAEQAVRKERESFRKRRYGSVKKNEQLKRVWPFCDIEQKVHDHATGQYYLFQTSNVDFPSISELVSPPSSIWQLF